MNKIEKLFEYTDYSNISPKYLWETDYIVCCENERWTNVVLFKDKYGAVIKAKNNRGEEQHYYKNEQDYLDSIKD